LTSDGDLPTGLAPDKGGEREGAAGDGRLGASALQLHNGSGDALTSHDQRVDSAQESLVMCANPAECQASPPDQPS